MRGPERDVWGYITTYRTMQPCSIPLGTLWPPKHLM